jgi:hypothetical protein
MLKQQVVSTSLGQLTVSSLPLGDLRELDKIFAETAGDDLKRLSTLLKLVPIIWRSVQKVHQDLALDSLENGLSLEDFLVLFNAVLDVSGLVRAPAGEATPVAV